MSYTTILTSLTDHTLLVTINRPDKMNALNHAVFTDLDLVMDEIINNNDIHSAIITGSGTKAFVAGADITEFAGLSKENAMALSKRGQDVFFKIENCPKPIIAAVNGFALGGGCELAMACHFRICSENAKFGQPEVNLGLIPGYGATQRLTQLIGKGRSMELHMTASLIDAQQALSFGLVNHVTIAETLIEKAMSILQLIHTKAPFAIGKIVECVNLAVVNQTEKSGYSHEVEAFGDCFATEDMLEGTTAFIEKRKPVFTGK